MIRVLGLDLSLRATGFALGDGDGHMPRGVLNVTLTSWPRLAAIRERVLGLVKFADVVVIEGYSFGQSRGSSQMFAAGELGGVVRLALYELDVPFAEIPPATLKKFATGRGNSPKEAMLQAAWKRLGYDGTDHNIADALFLCLAGLAHYAGDQRMPKAQRDALAKVRWPSLNQHDTTKGAA